ncbi:hypothetical protein B0T24DRAFT_679514 [Lasiosphaeria ovina]|uniref:Uncharacterized protein n=1 Tax=Lasiosphaeria ovina TaxID=92902 RepID=A0AAE0N8I0_9PEZI|nr:hypothetical protein B0T24DRAFT_679514 [Lasiosphaeria ovina]
MYNVGDGPASRRRAPRRSTSRHRYPNPHNDDDDWTLYDDTDSISSSDSEDDYMYRPPVIVDPPLTAAESHPLDMPAYEVHRISMNSNTREVVGGYRFIGVNVEQFKQFKPWNTSRPEQFQESDLADMHLRAISEFQAKDRRCLASRILGAKAKTYEQGLEDRCRRLPAPVREELAHILTARGIATSSPCRIRSWSVAVMQEQLRERFTTAEPVEVKRHKIRFWKNPGSKDLVDYLFVIRGAETKTCNGIDGFKTAARNGNPWEQADINDDLRKFREARERRAEELLKTRTSPPSYRSRRREREGSPVEIRRRPVTRTRVPVRRRNDWHGDIVPLPRYPESPRSSYRCAPPPAPTPPRSYSPPPGVARYNRPSVVAPPYPDRSVPLPMPVPVSRDVYGDYAMPPPPRPFCTVDAPMYNPDYFGGGGEQQQQQHRSSPPPPPFTPEDLPPPPFGGPPGPLPYFGSNCTPSASCPACAASPRCQHFPGDGLCNRVFQLQDSGISHPPCFFCLSDVPAPAPARFPTYWPTFPHSSPPPPAAEPLFSSPEQIYRNTVCGFEAQYQSGPPPVPPHPPLQTSWWADCDYDEAVTELSVSDDGRLQNEEPVGTAEEEVSTGGVADAEKPSTGNNASESDTAGDVPRPDNNAL